MPEVVMSHAKTYSVNNIASYTIDAGLVIVGGMVGNTAITLITNKVPQLSEYNAELTLLGGIAAAFSGNKTVRFAGAGTALFGVMKLASKYLGVNAFQPIIQA